MEASPSLLLQEQLALRLETEISKKMDKIIDNIRTIAKDFSIAEKDKKSPFRNVLAAATESGSSLEVIKNYIRYQVGRSGASPIWKHTKNKKLFSTVVVEQIDNLQQEAAEIVLRIRESTPKGHPLSSYLENGQKQAQLQKEIHLKLAQLYLGYLAREHTASVGEKQAQENQHPN